MSNLLIVVVIFFGSLFLRAQSDFEPLYLNEPTSENSNLLNDIISEVNQHIPKSMTQKANHIEISVVMFNSKSLQNITDICHSTVFLSGRATGKQKILLNKNYLDFLKTDSETLIPCLKRTLRQQIKSVLVHEYMHIYDNQNSTEFVNKCVSFDTEVNVKCDYLNQNSNILSGQKKFRMMSENIDINFAIRSPNRYEYTNYKENLAVNFEYFIFDSEYKCRRPTYYEFFESNLNHSPFPQTNCDAFQYLVMSEDRSLVQFNAHFIQDIRILNVSRGKNLDELFGHIMLQFNFCLLKQKKGLDFKCEDRQLNSIVLDFGTLSQGTGRGTPIFARSLDQVLINYNYRSNRSVESYALKLNTDQLQSITKFSLQQFWNFKADYSSTKNNCANIIFNFIFSILNSDDDILYMNTVMTPEYLKNILMQNKMLEINSRINYSQNEENLKLSILKSKFLNSGIELSFDNSVENALLRRKFYLSIERSTFEENYVDFIFIESLLLRRAQFALLVDLEKTLKTKKDDLALRSLKQIDSETYGVPSIQELTPSLQERTKQGAEKAQGLSETDISSPRSLNTSELIRRVAEIRNNIFSIKYRK